jgi:hypothetical protein
VSSKQFSNEEAKFVFKIGALDILMQPINPWIFNYKIILIVTTYKQNKKEPITLERKLKESNLIDEKINE